MSDNNKPITKEMMEAYVSVLEKQVSQMSLVVTTLEELNDKLEKVEGHFNNGFKSEIKDHVTEQIKEVRDKTEEAIKSLIVIQKNVEKSTTSDKELNDKAYELTSAIKDKIGGLSAGIAELKSAIKIDRATNIIGLSTFIIGILTIILKLFGKL